jgi:cob(I)alamin adenosyltransferase
MSFSCNQKSNLYTGKGDDGTTKLFDSKSGERISKASSVTEGLGTLDEINSFLGLLKIKSADNKFCLKKQKIDILVHKIQKDLFIVQAELAGAKVTIKKDKIKNLEKIISEIEKELPPIKTFFISGGSELAVLFDMARTMIRTTERRVVEVCKSGRHLGIHSLSYLNRLSSLFYALARYANFFNGIKEESPDYK